MTISITLAPDQARKLEVIARRDGKDLSTYVNDMLIAYLNSVEPKGEKTFEKILAPVWEGWQQSGMTEEEIDDLFRQELPGGPSGTT